MEKLFGGRNKALRRAVINSVVLIMFYIFSSQLFATLWILILPIGLLVVLFFAVAAIKNILFYIRNRKVQGLVWLPLLIQVFAALVVYFIPSSDRSKKHYLTTASLNSGYHYRLYTEYYSVFEQGAFGTGLNSEYLTDSLNFRKYLGTYDEGDEAIGTTCKGDTIIVTKTSTEFINTMWSKPQVLERKTYSLSDLKKQHVSD